MPPEKARGTGIPLSVLLSVWFLFLDAARQKAGYRKPGARDGGKSRLEADEKLRAVIAAYQKRYTVKVEA